MKNNVDELMDVGNIILNEHDANIKNISYPIKGFKEPLTRKINVSEYSEYERFVSNLNKHDEKKKELEEIYSLTDYRVIEVCAINKETLESIKDDLDKAGLLYKKDIII